MFTCFRHTRALIALLALTAAPGVLLAADNPYLGGWELTIPGGGAGWLGVEEVDGRLQASLLWGGGSVLPLESAKVEDGKLILTRKHTAPRKGKNGKNAQSIRIETITATADGDTLKLSSETLRENGQGADKANFTGRREPAMPPAPDLNQVKFGEPIRLFNGKSLAGWRLTDPHANSGWSAKDGLLVNEVAQEEGKPRKHYGNLRTDKEFEDFNLTLETCVAKGGNSGVYLRGIYEVQVVDSYGKPLDPHNMGAIYSRIKPTVAAEKPAGEWQTMDITFVDRHVTVILNGQKIIDNQPILGCTGGALWSDVTRPGPIYLQGDHTGIEYRNIVLKPVVK
jgi:3-keto-disaccharide hydrolase